MLRELGWVDARTERDDPRKSDLTIRSRESPPSDLRRLKTAIKLPARFIGMVFGMTIQSGWSAVTV